MARRKTDKTELTPPATSATRAGNEWGVPDWRDESTYGDEIWSFNRWRWEFYRRRDDLRTFFDRWAGESYTRNLRCNEGKFPNEPGFKAFGSDNEKGDAVRCFDYGGVPNPRIGNQPAICIMPIDQFRHKFRFYNPAKRKPSGFSVLEALGKKPSKIYELNLQDHEYAIEFDLNKPLRSQVNEALKILKDAQIKLHGKPVQRKQQANKWFGYLRTLDARAAAPSSSWRSFTEELYTAGLVDRHADGAGGYCAPPPQAGRDKWAAANALRFNF